MKKFLISLVCSAALLCSGMDQQRTRHFNVPVNNLNQNDYLEQLKYRYSEEDEPLMRSSLQNAPEKIKGIIRRLKQPEIYDNRGLNAILLVGASGTGKTVLSRAMARVLGSTCYFVAASSLLEKHRNAAAQKIYQLFQGLAKCSHKITLVIDEVNALTDNFGSENTDTADTAKALWTMLDAFESNNNFLFIGTTNEAKKMPPQLQSRFKGCRVLVPLPSTAARKNILIFYLQNTKNVTLDESCNNQFLNELVLQINNYSIRDIKQLIKEALTCFAMEHEAVSKIIFSKSLLEKALENIKKESEEFDNANSHLTDEERRHQENMSLSKQQHAEQLKRSQKQHAEQLKVSLDGIKHQTRLAIFNTEMQRYFTNKQENFQVNLQQNQWSEQKNFQFKEGTKGRVLQGIAPFIPFVGPFVVAYDFMEHYKNEAKKESESKGASPSPNKKGDTYNNGEIDPELMRIYSMLSEINLEPSNNQN